MYRKGVLLLGGLITAGLILAACEVNSPVNILQDTSVPLEVEPTSTSIATEELIENAIPDEVGNKYFQLKHIEAIIEGPDNPTSLRKVV